MSHKWKYYYRLTFIRSANVGTNKLDNLIKLGLSGVKILIGTTTISAMLNAKKPLLKIKLRTRKILFWLCLMLLVESVKTCASWLFVYLLLLTVVLAFYWLFVLIGLCFACAGICGEFYLDELQDEKLEDEDNTSKYGNHMSDADTYMSIAHDCVPLNGPENIEKNHEIYKNRYFKQVYDLDKDLTTKEVLPYSRFTHKRNTPENIEENHRRHANKNKPENLKQAM